MSYEEATPKIHLTKKPPRKFGKCLFAVFRSQLRSNVEAPISKSPHVDGSLRTARDPCGQRSKNASAARHGSPQLPSIVPASHLPQPLVDPRQGQRHRRSSTRRVVFPPVTQRATWPSNPCCCRPRRASCGTPCDQAGPGKGYVSCCTPRCPCSGRR